MDSLEGAYYIEKLYLDSSEAADYLSRFLSRILSIALDSLPNSEDRISKQIELSNALVKWLADYLHDVELSENLLDSQGEILSALFSTQNPVAADLKAHVAKITPLT
ncbi:MAG: hypothetical protein HQL49_13205, partial [Gammaproteobacteria bacterium]|nr:hypothetical protein [Gammaproteobacteria bacterium]